MLYRSIPLIGAAGLSESSPIGTIMAVVPGISTMVSPEAAIVGQRVSFQCACCDIRVFQSLLYRYLLDLDL